MFHKSTFICFLTSGCAMLGDLLDGRLGVALTCARNATQEVDPTMSKTPLLERGMVVNQSLLYFAVILKGGQIVE